MTRKILFPTDFSPRSNAALEAATAFALERDAKLLIVHVEEPPAAYGGGELYYGVESPNREELLKSLQAVLPTDSSVGYEHRLTVGDPAQAIVNLAAEEGVDMIVLSTHGRTGLMRLLMGSVAEVVVRRAGCPVMTVKPTAIPRAESAAHA